MVESVLALDLEEALDRLRRRSGEMRDRWATSEPFRHVIVEDFLPRDFAEAIYDRYPTPEAGGWENTTYVHQRKKLTMRSGFPSAIDAFFRLAADPRFLDMLTDITGIPALQTDHDLVGGGLHQILRGGFLDLHVDYNLHPRTKLHRRLNLLLYMNKDWKSEYQGDFELWDFEGPPRRIAKIAPAFNRAVMFEMSEISYHGHPEPLATPRHVTRKSLALYYYTVESVDGAPEHNSLYRRSIGTGALLRHAISASEAAIQRLRAGGPGRVARDLVFKLGRRVRGLPPVNR